MPTGDSGLPVGHGRRADDLLALKRPSTDVSKWPNAGVPTTEEPSFAPAVLPADGNRYIARMRCVTLTPFASVRAIRPLPIPLAVSSRTAASVSASILGRPKGLLVRVLHAQACARASLSLVAQR